MWEMWAEAWGSHRLHLGWVILLLPSRDTIFSSSSLRPSLRLLQSLFGRPNSSFMVAISFLCLCALQQWFDLEEEASSRPVLDSHEGPDIPLDNQQESLQGPVRRSVRQPLPSFGPEALAPPSILHCDSEAPPHPPRPTTGVCSCVVALCHLKVWGALSPSSTLSQAGP